MSEALLGEPQTPTAGDTTAKAPASNTSSVPDQGKQQSGMVDSKNGLLTTPTEKTATPVAEKATPAAEKAVPAEVKYELKLDGEAKLSPTMQKGFETAARDAGLTNEAANKLLNSLVKTHQESQQTSIDALKDQWAEESRANKEWGGDKLPETLANAKKALNEFGSKELNELLEVTGLTNNEHFIALLAKVQRKVGGDKVVTGAIGNAQDNQAAKVMFPSMA